MKEASPSRLGTALRLVAACVSVVVDITGCTLAAKNCNLDSRPFLSALSCACLRAYVPSELDKSVERPARHERLSRSLNLRSTVTREMNPPHADVVVSANGTVSPLPTELADMIEVTMLGAGLEVGRSCCVIKFKGATVVCDAGLHPAFSGIPALPCVLLALFNATSHLYSNCMDRYVDELDWSSVDAILITQCVLSLRWVCLLTERIFNIVFTKIMQLLCLTYTKGYVTLLI